MEVGIVRDSQTVHQVPATSLTIFLSLRCISQNSFVCKCRNPIYTGLSLLKEFPVKWKWKYRARPALGVAGSRDSLTRSSLWLPSPNCPSCQAASLQKVTTEQIQTYLPWACYFSRQILFFLHCPVSHLNKSLALPGWGAHSHARLSGREDELHWSESESRNWHGGNQGDPFPMVWK